MSHNPESKIFTAPFSAKNHSPNFAVKIFWVVIHYLKQGIACSLCTPQLHVSEAYSQLVLADRFGIRVQCVLLFIWTMTSLQSNVPQGSAGVSSINSCSSHYSIEGRKLQVYFW